MKTKNYIKKLLLVLFAGFTGFTAFAQNYYQVYTKDGGLAQQAGDQINKVAVESNAVQFYQTGVPGTPVYSKAVALVDSITILPYIPVASLTETCTIEAETCTEGYGIVDLSALNWLTGWPSTIYAIQPTPPPAKNISYPIYVTDAGKYDFKLWAITWSSDATIDLYIDGNIVKTATMSKIDYVLDNPFVFFNNITLPSGKHVIKFVYNSSGNELKFDKFTIAVTPLPVASQAAPVTIESDASTEGYSAVMPIDWLFENQSYIIIDENQPTSYNINVTDAGNYDFKLNAVTWASNASIGLYIDNSTTATATVPIIKIDLSYRFADLNNVVLPSGNHVITFKLLNSEGAQLHFNKFTITYHP